MGGEKIQIDRFTRRFPTDRFRAVFTEAERAAVVITPGTAGAVKSFRFIDPQQVSDIFQRLLAVENKARGGFQRAPAASRIAVWLDGWFEFHDMFRR
jgi:hypothetical protein